MPSLDQLIELTYEIYSKHNDISYEDYVKKVVNDEEFEYIFIDLCEKLKIEFS
jgi:uncharacterized protein YihD (DUF1040 family)